MTRRLVVFLALIVVAVATANAAFSGASFLTGSTTAVSASTSEAGDNRLELNDGDGQTAEVGTEVAVAPSVRASDAAGNPVSGLVVMFSVTSGGGSVSGAVVTTGADGVARVGAWTLGTTAGDNGLTAVAAGLPGVSVSFTATGAPGPADRCVVTAADLTPAAGSDVNVEAQLTDRYGNAVGPEGIPVAFAASGAASVTGANPVMTDAEGRARTTVTAGTVAGETFTVTAQGDGSAVAGASPVLTVVAAAPYRIALAAGDGQSAPAGEPVAVDPGVLVTDRYDNPCQGVGVLFNITAGGGSVDSGAATTDASGIATSGSWALGAVAGPNELAAIAEGLAGSPVVFTATGLAGPPTRYVVSASSYWVFGGATVTVSAQLADGLGNAVRTSGVQVIWSVAGAGGSLTPVSSVTDAGGVATTQLTVGTVMGSVYTVTATDGSGLSGTSDAITVAAGAPRRIDIVAGDGQTAAVGTAVAVPPRVLVTDVHGNPCPGVTVRFSVLSGGGSVTGEVVVSDDAGTATVGGWTLGGTAGANTLRASGDGMPPGQRVTFEATAVAGPGAAYAVTSSSNDPRAGATVTISAQLTDVHGNPVAEPGVTVTWSSTGAGGSFGSGTSVTSGSGVATVTFITGALSGNTYVVTAADAPGRTGTTAPITTR